MLRKEKKNLRRVKDMTESLENNASRGEKRAERNLQMFENRRKLILLQNLFEKLKIS